MDANCVWCYAPLGRNETIEHFPVGRRIAYDAAKGWLWAVCRKCERWSLAPIEERWEAMEECERLFEKTRLRVSTSEIGMARVGDGLELVRIGAPLRPEFAAWRYGDQFARRRRRMIIGAAIAVPVVGLVVVAPPVMGLVSASSFGLINWALQASNFYVSRRTRARVSVPGEDDQVFVRGVHLRQVKLSRTDGDWALRVAYDLGGAGEALDQRKSMRTVELRGEQALSAASRLLPAINAAGANRGSIQSAVKLLDETPSVNDLFLRFSPNRREKRFWFPGVKHAAPPAWTYTGQTEDEKRDVLYAKSLSSLPVEVRLALEMAAHEDLERRAMVGELEELKLFWHEAAEIASTSDAMFESPAIQDAVRKLKSRS